MYLLTVKLGSGIEMGLTTSLPNRLQTIPCITLTLADVQGGPKKQATIKVLKPNIKASVF